MRGISIVIGCLLFLGVTPFAFAIGDNPFDFFKGSYSVYFRACSENTQPTHRNCDLRGLELGQDGDVYQLTEIYPRGTLQRSLVEADSDGEAGVEKAEIRGDRDAAFWQRTVHARDIEGRLIQESLEQRVIWRERGVIHYLNYLKTFNGPRSYELARQFAIKPR